MKTWILLAISVGGLGSWADVEARRAPRRPTYCVVDLGTFGGDRSMATALNDRGQVVGFAGGADGSSAFLWDDGAAVGIDPIGNPRAINRRGDVVGSAELGDGTIGSVIWNDGEGIELEGISASFGMNDRGEVVGNSSIDGALNAQLWIDGEVTELGTLGGHESRAHAIDRRRRIVGWAQTADGDTHAFLWEHGTMRDLGALDGGWSVAYDINRHRQIVGASMTASGEIRAALWDDGTLIDLGGLPGARFTHAWGINDRGQVVGNSENHAFLWQRGVMWDVNDLLAAGSDAEVIDAADINRRGEIAATAIIGGTSFHAVLLRPCR